MPKWKKNKKTEKEGVIYLEDLVNKHGSIFREVPGDKDTGIDGFIEFVCNEEATGKILAVQIKSGDSYYEYKENKFVLYPDQDHIDYWEKYTLPVVLVFYSPSAKCGAWIGIDEHLKRLKYHNKPLLSKIEIKVEANNIDISDLKLYMDMKYDSLMLLHCMDRCYDLDNDVVFENFQILINHPDSRDNKSVIKIARELIESTNIEIAREALWYLGYCVGRQRWSWNPNTLKEKQVIGFSSELCIDIPNEVIYKLLCIVDEEAFSGSMGLGERLLDIIACCYDDALEILDKVVKDSSEPMQRRANALRLLYGDDEEWLEEDIEAQSFIVEY